MAQKVKDVVCEMMVDPDTAPAKAEYKGETYYFCSPGCKVSFERNPEQYLHPEHASGHGDTHHHGHQH